MPKFELSLRLNTEFNALSLMVQITNYIILTY